MAPQILSLEKMKEKVGTELGVTEWLQIDQERITQFAECTMDKFWIHVDEEKATKGPFGKTIAHGYLTVSLISPFLAEHIILPDNGALPINYGMNKVRLMTPVTVGSRIRDRIYLASLEEKSAGLLMTTTHTIEIEGQEKPAMYAEQLQMFY